MILGGTQLEILYRRLTTPQQRKVDGLYKKFVSSKSCLVSRKKPVQVHHHRTSVNAGMGLKPKDIYCVPLHVDYHTGKYGIHKIGIETFVRKFKIDFEEELKKIHEEFVGWIYE